MKAVRRTRARSRNALPAALVHRAGVLFLVLVVTGLRVQAQDEDERLTLNTTLKLTGVGARAPSDPILYPERDSATGLTRLRLGLTGDVTDAIAMEAAYELRAQATTADAGAGGSALLPRQADAPFRIRQLDWRLGGDEEDSAYARHEIDRLLLTWRPAWGDVTVGRQALGLGRGVVFSAVDLFNPFTPLEVDREWRRGVDAARAEWRVTETSAIGAFAVAGEDWSDSAFLARARGYVGQLDASLLAGWRAEDLIVGGTVSAAVVDAELHADAAVFRTDEPVATGGDFGREDTVVKAVVGGSYTFDVGTGLTLLAEYQYSGFGAEDAEDITVLLADPRFRARYLRGDMQTLSEQAVALQASYAFGVRLSGALLLLVSPRDGSGVLQPAFTWDLSQRLSLVSSLTLPWGPGPADGRLRSAYGGTPVSAYIQLNLYY